MPRQVRRHRRPGAAAPDDRARRRHVAAEAVLVGGAQMFAAGASGSLDIGRRNEQAVRTALAVAGIAVTAAVTGGSSGRTMRVHLGHRPRHLQGGRQRRGADRQPQPDRS